MFTMNSCLPSLLLPRLLFTTVLALAALFGLIPRAAAAESNDAGATPTGTAPQAAERKPKVPPFSVVEQVVARELAKKPGYKSGDLITRGDVANVKPELEKLGFPVNKTSKGLEVLLPDDHPLAVALRTPQGEAVASKIKNLEIALDRMDRLCHFHAGLELVQKVVVAPNSLEVIEQLCAPESVQGLAAKYPHEPACQVLDFPSGRAFTQRQYLEHLRTIHMLAVLGLTRPGE
jgi:hypothetical protein